MSSLTILLTPETVIDTVGSDVFLYHPSSGQVASLPFHLLGDLPALQAGGTVDCEDSDSIRHLEQLGLIEVSPTTSLSRRTLLTSAAAGAAGSAIALSLPAAAAASSFVCPVVAGNLDEIGAVNINGTTYVRLQLSGGFSPPGNYWLEVFDNPTGDEVTRGGSLGLKQVELPAGEDRIIIAKSEYGSPTGPGDEVIGVLYSDDSRVCVVGEIAGDFD